MLVLSRKVNETIIIDGHIEIMVVAIGRNKVRVGIKAPAEVTVNRGEVQDQIRLNQDAESEPKTEENLDQ